MILRSLAEAIREQNWFAIVLEILILVVGIFVGLQVNDWNQVRQDRAVETRYLERLQIDLLADLSRLDRAVEVAKIRMQQVELLLDGIADPEVAAGQPNQFIEAVEKAAWGSYRPLTPNAYSELISTGRTTLIRSESIRDALTIYYARIGYWVGIMNQASFEHEYSMAIAGVLDINYMAAIEDSGPRSGLADLGAERGDAILIAESLKSRVQGVRLLPMIYKSHVLVKDVVTVEHRERNEALQIAIEEQLKGGRDNP